MLAVTLNCYHGACDQVQPVCGANQVTYANECSCLNSEIQVAHFGSCGQDIPEFITKYRLNENGLENAYIHEKKRENRIRRHQLAESMFDARNQHYREYLTPKPSLEDLEMNEIVENQARRDYYNKLNKRYRHVLPTQFNRSAYNLDVVDTVPAQQYVHVAPVQQYVHVAPVQVNLAPAQLNADFDFDLSPVQYTNSSFDAAPLAYGNLAFNSLPLIGSGN